jgi:hypothetical protein
MLDTFTAAYLEAVEFAPSLDETELDADWSDTIASDAGKDCAAFYAANEDDILAYGVREAGHDFWFTRNGHGVGFWENDHGTPEVCARLDAAAKDAGPVDMYAGKDGLIHFG